MYNVFQTKPFEAGIEMGIAGFTAQPVELLRAEIADAGRKLEAEQVEQGKDDFRVPDRIGRMLDEAQFGFVVQDTIEHVGGIAHRRRDDLGAVLRELIGRRCKNVTPRP